MRVLNTTPLLAELVSADDAQVVWDGLSLGRHRGVVDPLREVRVLFTNPGARTFEPEAVRPPAVPESSPEHCSPLPAPRSPLPGRLMSAGYGQWV